MLRELVEQTRTMLAEPDTSVNQFWTDEELKNFLNIAYRQFCLDTKYLRKSIYTQLTAENSEATLPSTVMKIYTINLNNGEKIYPLLPISYEELLENYNMKQTSIRPYYYYIREGNVIGVYPAPKENIYLYVSYACEPASLVNDTDNPDIPDRYSLALCNYACYLALLKYQDTSVRASAYLLNYQNLVVRAIRELSTLTKGTSIRPHNYREEFKF